MRFEFEFVLAAVRLRVVKAVVPVVGEGKTLHVADIPVEFDQQLLIRVVTRLRDLSDVVLVNLAGNTADFVEFGLRNENLVDCARADRATIEQVGAV